MSYVYKKYKTAFFCCLLFLTIAGCAKQTSYYYPDAATPGTAIFSNTSNNVLSCLIGDSSWRTITRSAGGVVFTRPIYEVFIEIHITNSATDTLSIVWRGNPATYQGNYSVISLVLPVAKSFRMSDLAAFEAKRIVIDGSNGIFRINLTGLPAGNISGNGRIYFNRIHFEAAGTNSYTGYISGLLETDLGLFNIRSGRFDHYLNPDQITIY
jgi:hypothetical protein